MTKLLQSERMWNDMTIVVRALFPALIVLRLADKKQPSMDKLYFYVRRMEETLKRSKSLLDPLEEHYNDNNYSNDLSSNIMGYFLETTKDNAEFGIEFMAPQDHDDEISEDSDGDDNVSIEKDYEDDDEDAITVLSASTTKTLGDKLIDIWNHRKQKLETDLSICGWMVSPHAEIMQDVRLNQDGTHRDAVDRVIEKWFEHEVSICIYNSNMISKMQILTDWSIVVLVSF